MGERTIRVFLVDDHEVVRRGVADLLEREPERAAVLLGMSPSLVATAPYSPSATRVTETYQLGRREALRCRNDDIQGLTNPEIF